jgi:hypothetical protein
MTVAGIAFAGPASAGPYPLTCTKLVASPTALTGTVSGCTVAVSGGSGKLSHFLPSGGQIAWKNGTSTTYKSTASGESDTDHTPCPAGSSEVEVRGSVTASTNSHLPKGDPVTFEVCVTRTKIVNEKGSTFNI